MLELCSIKASVIKDSRLLLSYVHSYSVVKTMEFLGHRLLPQCNTIKQIIAQVNKII